MPGIVVGSVSVTVVPDAGRFGSDLQAGLDGPIREIGDRITQQVADALRQGIANAPTSDAARTGASTGASFADSFRARVEEALRSLPSIQIDGDTTTVDRKLDELRSRLLALSSARVGVDLDAATALAELARVRAELDELARSTPDVDVRVDIARAQASLAEIQAEIDRLDDETPEVDVKVDDHGSADATSRSLGGLGSVLVSLLPLAAPIGAALVAGLVAAGTTAAAVVGGLGVLALGISGVSNAVKLLGQEHAAAGKDAARSASASVNSAAQEAAAAQQIKSAQQSLADARRSAAESAVDSAEKVRTAQQSLVDAEQRAAQDQIDAAKGVAQAKQNLAAVELRVAEQRRQADQQVASAEYDYTQSVQRVQDAEQSLVDARRAAQRDLQNYADSQVDANLSQKQAVLDLQTAQARYDSTSTSSSATDQQKAQALLDLQKAQQSLVEANERLQSSTEDNTKAQRAGVDGAPGVVAAGRAITQSKHDQQAAADSLSDAERAQTAQQRQGAQDVANAEAGLTDAVRKQAQQQVASAESVAKAQQGVSDAVRDQGRAQQDAAERVARAQDQVASANRAAATASARAGLAGTSALAAIQAQLDKVNPATLQFAKFFRANIEPAFKNLQNTAAKNLLPGLEKGFKALQPLFPVFNRIVGILATTLGNLFTQAGKALNSPFWRQFFDYVGRVAGPYLETFGKIIGNFIKGIAGLMEAFEPITNAIGRGLLTVSRAFASFGAGASRTSGFQTFLGYVRANGPVVVDAIKNIATIIGKLLVGLAPLGSLMLRVIDVVAKFLAKFSPDQLLLIAAAIGAIVTALGGPLIGAVVAATAIAALLVRNWSKIKPAIQPVLDIFMGVWHFIRDKLVPVIEGILMDAWEGIKNALHTVGQAIESHKAQLTTLFNFFKAIATFIVQHVYPILGPLLKAAFEILGHAIAWVIDLISDLVDWVVAIKDAAVAVGRWFAGPFVHFFTTAWDAVKMAFSTVSDWVSTIWANAWSAIQTIIVAPIRWAANAISTLWDAVKTAFQNAVAWVSSAFQKSWSVVQTIVTAPIRAARTAISAVWTGIRTAFNAARSWVTSVFSRAWNAVKTIVTAPINAARSLIGSIWSGIRNAFSSAWQWVSRTFSSAWHKITEVITAPIRVARNAISTIWDGIKSGARTFMSGIRTIWDGIKKIFEAPIKFVVNTVFNDGIRKAWNWIADKIPGIPSIDPIRLPFAKGGVVPGYAPGVDSVHAVLSPGEGILVPEATRALGGEVGIAAINSRYSARVSGPGRFAGGGVTGKNPNGDPTVSDILGQYKYSTVHTGAPEKLVAGPLNPLHWVEILKDKFTSAMAAIHRFDSTEIGKIVVGMPTGAVSKMVDYATSLAKKAWDFLVGDGSNTLVPGRSLAGGGSKGYYGNAKTIIDVAKSLGLGVKGAEIGLETALAESNLKNYANANIPESLSIPHDAVGSDHYSAGIFQQQTGPFGDYWGSVVEVMHPQYAAARFFKELLNKVPNWRNLPSGVDAQMVQVSQFPDAYAARQGEADSLITRIGFDSGGWLEPGPSLVYNGTGQRELIAPAASFQQAIASMGGTPGGGDVHVKVQIGDEAIDPRLVRVSHRVVDQRVSTAKAREARGVQGGPLKQLER